MTNIAEQIAGRRLLPWRILGWGTAALLLLLPAVANAAWTPFDFVLMAVVFGSVGIAFELIVRKPGSLAYRLGAGLAFVAAILTFLINGAVGMIGSADNEFNLLFGGVLLVALAGALLSRFQAAGMVRAMGAASVVQGGIGAIGMTSDLRGGALSIAFAGLWLLAAAAFRVATRERHVAAEA